MTGPVWHIGISPFTEGSNGGKVYVSFGRLGGGARYIVSPRRAVTFCRVAAAMGFSWRDDVSDNDCVFRYFTDLTRARKERK